MIHPSALPTDQLVQLCQFSRTRRSGPGGQHRNKVESAVVVVHQPTGIRAEANERRSQHENRKVAIQRLRLLLAIDFRLPLIETPIRATSQSKECSARWRSRVRGGRLHISSNHDDFPALLAESLDKLQECGWEPVEAAAELGITSSQLVKLLKIDMRGLKKLNDQRAGLGLHSIR